MAFKEGWLWLAAGLGFGAVNSGELFEACPGGPNEVAAELGGTKLDAILTQKQAERLASSRAEDFAIRVRQIESQNIHVLGFSDEDYPTALRVITNPPPVLFVKGDVGLMNGQLSIGMVGARRPSAYGIEAMKAIGQGVALGGAIIVSGLASGLDAEAHKAALAVNGPTIACIAFGHHRCYPAANKKLMEVIERHGAVVSEYLPDTEPEKPYFLQRNRLIAGLSHGLVVVEARKYSGTMSTVNFAIDYGRDVFAVPGSIFSELSGGTNAMIREGAYIACSAGDVLLVYGVQPKSEFELTNGENAHEKTNDRVSTDKRAENERMLTDVIKAKQAEQQSFTEASQSTLLNERVAAVSDTVEFSDSSRQKVNHGVTAVHSTDEDAKVQPYPWHKVERLPKDIIESEPHASSSKNRSVASRLLGAQPAVTGEHAQKPAQTVTVPQPVVKPVEPTVTVPTGTPVPANEKRHVTYKADQSLAGRLSTVAKQPVHKPILTGQPVAKPLQTTPPPVKDIQSGEVSLSSAAKRALAQLGVKPVAFADICKRSGLSSAEAMAALTELELAGRSRQLAGRQFVVAEA